MPENTNPLPRESKPEIDSDASTQSDLETLQEGIERQKFASDFLKFLEEQKLSEEDFLDYKKRSEKYDLSSEEALERQKEVLKRRLELENIVEEMGLKPEREKKYKDVIRKLKEDVLLRNFEEIKLKFEEMKQEWEEHRRQQEEKLRQHLENGKRVLLAQQSKINNFEEGRESARADAFLEESFQ